MQLKIISLSQFSIDTDSKYENGHQKDETEDSLSHVEEIFVDGQENDCRRRCCRKTDPDAG